MALLSSQDVGVRHAANDLDGVELAVGEREIEQLAATARVDELGPAERVVERVAVYGSFDRVVDSLLQFHACASGSSLRIGSGRLSKKGTPAPAHWSASSWIQAGS